MISKLYCLNMEMSTRFIVIQHNCIIPFLPQVHNPAKL